MKRSYLKRQVGREVVLHLNEEASVRGVLGVVARDGVVLRAARYVGEADVPLDGDTFIPLAKVIFAQIPQVPRDPF